MLRWSETVEQIPQKEQNMWVYFYISMAKAPYPIALGETAYAGNVDNGDDVIIFVTLRFFV